MQPREVDMDLILMAEHELQKQCANTFSIDNETECNCPTDEQIRVIVAAVYDEIHQEGRISTI